MALALTLVWAADKIFPASASITITHTPSTTTLIATSGTLTTGTWFHAAATYDGTTMRLYKDGVGVGSMGKTGTISTSSSVAACIGNNTAGGVAFDGSIDDVAIYNRALSGAEITQIMSGIASGTPRCAAPVLDPAGGNFVASVDVTITCATGGATIYYTTDRNEPTVYTTEYAGPFFLDTSGTVQAVAVLGGYLNSTVSNQTYNISY